MIPLTIAELAEITHTTILGDLDPNTPVTQPVEFDSRNLKPGGIFMALPGARVDGHDFVETAYSQGAAAAIVGKDTGQPALLAPPTQVSEEAANASAFEFDPQGHGAAVIAAVDKLARHCTDVLSNQGMRVIGVTGSAGKTSTKDLIGAVLSAAGPTVAPPGSFNNEIGLPYTALRATEETQFLVAEMSARGVGHIRHLTTITPPHIGVVLNVGTAHLGEFGSRATIAQAKGELVEALPATGLAILNADDDAVRSMRTRTAAPVIWFSAAGDQEADWWASDITLDPLTRATFNLHNGEATWPVTLAVFGEHQVGNALAAIAVGYACGMDVETCIQAVQHHAATSAHRMDVRVRERDTVTIIDDAYNANPESMRAGIAALQHAANQQGTSSWAVLGQMGELGDQAIEEHAALGEHLATLGVDQLVVVGQGVNQHALATAAENAGVKTTTVETNDAAVNFIDLQLAPGDVVLIKASYSAALWQIAEGLLLGETELH